MAVIMAAQKKIRKVMLNAWNCFNFKYIIFKLKNVF